MSKMLRMHGIGLENLQLDEVELRPLADDEAKIQVKAFGITGDNLNYINGHFNPGEKEPDMPATFGYEAAGIVEEVGKNVDQAWLGKKVAPVGPYDFHKYGSAGDEIIVPADRLVEIPNNLTFTQAAALWIPYLTAYPVHEVQKGDYVLLPAATSTVGHAAIQYALDKGAIPIGTTRSAAKADILQKETGIKHVIVTTQCDLEKEIQKITDGHGVDFTFDPIGGKSITSLANASAYLGKIIEFGVIGGLQAPLPVGQLLGKGLTIKGFTVNEISSSNEKRQEATQYVLDRIKKGSFTPLVAKTFALNDYQAAFKQLQTNNLLGRVVITTE